MRLKTLEDYFSVFKMGWNAATTRNISGRIGDNDLTHYSEYQANIIIWRYLAPIILVVGTVGSILSLLVLCRKSLRIQTTMFYLSTLAVADLMVLYCGLVRLWLENAEQIYFRLTSRTACKLHNFFVYLSLDLSVWILVAVSIDRCLYVSWPVFAKKWCTLRNARVIISIIICFSGLVNMHFFWTYDLETSDSQQIYANGDKKCYADTSSRQTVSFILNVWPWIDFCVYCLFPFIFMATSNSIIIKQLLRTDRNMASYHNVVLDGKKESTEDRPVKWMRCSSKITPSATISSQKSNSESEETMRKQIKGPEGLNYISQKESFVLPIMSIVEGDRCSPHSRTVGIYQTSSIDAVYDDKFTSKVQDMRFNLETLERDHSLFDFKHQVTHDVLNVKPVNLECLEILPIKCETANTDFSETATVRIENQDYVSPNRIISIDVETHSGTHSLLNRKPSAKMHLLSKDTKFTVDLSSDTNQENIVADLTSGSTEPLCMNESVDLVMNLHPHQPDKDTNVTTNIQLSNEDQNKKLLVERKRPVSSIIYPVCTSLHEISSDIFIIEEPETPNTPDTSISRSSFWTTMNSERDLLVNNIKTDSRTDKNKLYETLGKVNSNIELDNQSINYENGRTVENRHSDTCHKEGYSRKSSSNLQDIVRNDIFQSVINSRGVNHEFHVTNKPSPTFKNKWHSMSTNSETINCASSRRNTRSVSKTLLAITIMFWIFNAPIMIFIIGHPHFVASANERGRAAIILGWGIVNILQYMNNALHFFLYCLTGPKFRHELMDMCKTWVRLFKKFSYPKSQIQ